MKLYFGLGISEAFAKGMSWLSLASLPLFVSPSKYGEITIIYSVLMMLFPLVLIGQDRVILSLRTKSDSQELFLSLSTCLFVSIILSGAISAYLIATEGLKPWAYLLIPFAALALAGNKILLCSLRNSSRYKAYSYNRIAYSTLRLLFVLISAAKFISITPYILAELIAALAATFQSKSTVKWQKIKFRAIVERVKEGLPLAIHGVSSGVLALSDRFLIGKFHSTEAVGNYNFSYTIASALVFSFAIISLVFEPRIYKSESNRELTSITSSCIKKMYAVGIPFSVLLSATYYFAFIFIDQYTPAPDVFFIILLAHLAMPIYLTSNYTLIRAGKAKTLLKCTFLAATTNIALNIIFIPIYGIVAAAITTLIGNLILAVLSLRAAKLSPLEGQPHSDGVKASQDKSKKTENTEKK